MDHQKPSLKYDHVYAIVRIDTFQDDDRHRFTVTKVMWDQDEAEAEVARLNALNQGKGAVYFCKLTRLERKS